MRRPAECLAGFAILLLVAASACATRIDMSIGTDCERGFCDDRVGFTSPDAGGEASLPETPLACVGTLCPAPYATCGDVASPLCSTNLMNDSENCGACGVSCGGDDLALLRMQSRCSDGACVFECIFVPGSTDRLFRDCNNTIDDGCEVDIFSDPKNCGLCGNVCPAGVRCIRGSCGCPVGELDCNGECIDPQSDNDNCKTCGNACTTPQNACSPMPPNTVYGCAGGECGKLKCAGGFGDCNNDVQQLGCASDGCESALLDSNNCGGCGVACAPGQECGLNHGGRPVCRDDCTALGLLRCRTINGEDRCVDPVTDPFDCGACGIRCGSPNGSEIGVCNGGVCTTACAPGFADCNGDSDDGCEVDLRSDAANCGACGIACDQRAGQPCIEGKCLMVECDGGVEAK